ncbi:uncharacterized protein LOC129238494 [Anastrepha obliqua]|uniref:uncharacterized protein LOC128856472 n=1 Tax=Anastrepha ludens TaxID=28586 RepID=UPI0023B0642F|nr:uncharacterized protein LOC128856472 [Anastrepha ludens]XP_054729505.1 uncharacterized protein LOC129238494 [Anastrepha obliqua]
MYKFVFVVIVALAAFQVQQNEAFIILSKSINAVPAAAASSVAAPAIDANALLQGVTSAVTAKLQAVNQVVGNLVQAKANFKQSLLSALPKPAYVTKTIRIPILVKTWGTTTAAATPEPAATTTVQSAGYAYRHRHR